MSETTPQAALYAALSRAVGKAQAVGKASENTYSNYKYASAEAIIEESRAVLAEEGLSVLPKKSRVVALPGGPVSTGGKAGMYFADLEVTYKVMHKDGGWEECEATTPACTDNGRPQDKGVATASTYNLGYFLRALLLLPRVDAEHDVDQRDDRQHPNPGRDDRKPQRQERRSEEKALAADAGLGGYDVEKVISKIRAATDGDVMQMIADNIANEAPKSAMPRLRAEWGKRKRELLEAQKGAAA